MLSFRHLTARYFASLVWAVLLLFVAETPGWTQIRPAAVARIQLLNKRAMDEFDSLEFDAATAALEEALGVAKSSGIGDGEELAETYLNLGILYGAGYNKRDEAVGYFTSALKLSPKIAIRAARATPGLEEIFEAARKQAQSDGGHGKVEHAAVDSGVTGRPIPLVVKVGVPGPVKVTVNYRGLGSANVGIFELIQQPAEQGTYRGEIPVQAVKGKSLQYYVTVVDATGKRIGGSGSNVNPNIIALTEGTEQPQVPPPKAPKRKYFSFYMMVGSGAGVVSGKTSEHLLPQANQKPAEVEIEPGVAVAPFHLAPEIAYHLTDKWQLGLLGRIQIVNAITEKSEISVLVQARAKRLFGDGPFKTYISFAAGGGQVRHRIPLGDYDQFPDTPDDRVDTRVAGLGCFGFGGGLLYMFSEYVGLVADLNGMILVPNFAAHADLNLGLALSF